MAYFIESELKNKHKNKFESLELSLESLNEDLDIYDIFLSHSYSDKELIYSVKSELEAYGYKVYIDWIDDNQLSREEVTKDTAEILKNRMDRAKSLVFVTTENSINSKWMPWELGYFDGKNGKVAILPVLKTLNDEFKGQEYLGLYDYITKNHLNKLFISNRKNPIKNGFFRDILSKTNFNDWLNQ